jgi:biopolymer transport protein ExbB
MVHLNRTKDGTMNRRLNDRTRRRSNWSSLFSVGSLAILVLAVILSNVDAQDSSTGKKSKTEATENGTNDSAASKDGNIPSEPYEIWIALGAFRYPLGLTSIIVVWFSIERIVVLRHGRVIPQHFVKRFFEHMEAGNLDPKIALKLCEDNGSPIALVLASGIRKWGKSSVEVEQAIIDGGERQVSQLRKHIRILNGAATVAPLLGLLGTVVGMIDSFNRISQKAAMGKSEALASGIGLSLLTTAAGLGIAIPALIMYMYFTGKVDSLVIEMDGIAQDLVDLISAEGLAEQARATKALAATKPEARRAV